MSDPIREHYSHTDPGSPTAYLASWPGTPTHWRGNTFVAATSYTLTEIRLGYYITSSLTVTWTFILMACDGSDIPTGSPLYSESKAIWTVTGSTNLAALVLSTPYVMTAGNKYWVGMWPSTGSLRWYYTPSGGGDYYTPGQARNTEDAGATWVTPGADCDCIFELYGTGAAATTEREATLQGQGGFQVTPNVTVSPSGVTLSGLGGFNMAPTFSQSLIVGKSLGDCPSLWLPEAYISTRVQGATSGSDLRFNNVVPSILPPNVAGADEHISTPTPFPTEVVGATQEDSHQWFEDTHLLPRLMQELGQIASTQVVPVELYNADRTGPITVSSVTDALGSGMTIAGIPATPFDIQSQRSLSATVTVATSGPLKVDAYYTFHTSVGDYTFYITGSRIVLFPIRPMAPMREHLLFDTSILEATDGTEQRVANRKTPRSMFELTIKGDRRRMEMLLFDRQNKVLATPAWHEPAFVSSPVSVGDATVNINTTDYANFYVGGYAILFQDEGVYDALEIQSIGATSLTFTSTALTAYPNNTQVMPLMLAYVQDVVATQKNLNNVQTFNLRLTVDAVDTDIADASAFSTRNGLSFLDDPNMVESGALSEVLEQKRLVLDNQTGLYGYFSQWTRNKRKSVKGFKTNSRQELWELRQFFHYLKGQQVAFYIPTFSNDIVPTEKLLNAGTAITMDFIGYTVNAAGRPAKDDIRVILNNGTILERTIVAWSELSQAQEQLSVDIAWPYDIEVADINRIEFIEKVRLSVDDITITHYNALGQSKTFVATTEVFD